MTIGDCYDNCAHRRISGGLGPSGAISIATVVLECINPQGSPGKLGGALGCQEFLGGVETMNPLSEMKLDIQFFIS